MRTYIRLCLSLVIGQNSDGIRQGQTTIRLRAVPRRIRDNMLTGKTSKIITTEVTCKTIANQRQDVVFIIPPA